MKKKTIKKKQKLNRNFQFTKKKKIKNQKKGGNKSLHKKRFKSKIKLHFIPSSSLL